MSPSPAPVGPPDSGGRPTTDRLVPAPQPAGAPGVVRDGAHPSPRDLLPYLLNRATNAINHAWMGTLRDHGLTIPRWQVLAVLVAFDGARVTDLAELVALEQPVASRVVAQMERDGLVARRPDPQDGRATTVWLSPEGRRLHGRLLPEATDFIDRLTRDITDVEVGALAGLLTRLTEEVSP